MKSSGKSGGKGHMRHPIPLSNGPSKFERDTMKKRRGKS